MNEDTYYSRALVLAQEFVQTYAGEELRRKERLDACFAALLTYPYKRYYDTPDASTWSDFAEDMFENQTGNCYRYAAAFACICHVLGYEVRVNEGQISTSSGMSGHGWAEVYVNGTWYVCDASMQRGNTANKYYLKHRWQISKDYAVNAAYRLRVSEGVVSWEAL